MGLSDEDIHEVHLVAPPHVELFQRLDRADGDGSRQRPEVQEDRLAAQRAQAQ